MNKKIPQNLKGFFELIDFKISHKLSKDEVDLLIAKYDMLKSSDYSYVIIYLEDILMNIKMIEINNIKLKSIGKNKFYELLSDNNIPKKFTLFFNKLWFSSALSISSKDLQEMAKLYYQIKYDNESVFVARYKLINILMNLEKSVIDITNNNIILMANVRFQEKKNKVLRRFVSCSSIKTNMDDIEDEPSRKISYLKAAIDAPKIGLGLESKCIIEKVSRKDVVIDEKTKSTKIKKDKSILYTAGWSLKSDED